MLTNLATSHLDPLPEGGHTDGRKEDECSVYEDFKRNVSFREGRYEVHLPWKEPHPELTDNYELSQRRLDGLLK